MKRVSGADVKLLMCIIAKLKKWEVLKMKRLPMDTRILSVFADIAIHGYITILPLLKTQDILFPLDWTLKQHS
jgi:hypothetical protein